MVSKLAEIVVSAIRPFDIPGVNRTLGRLMSRQGTHNVSVSSNIRMKLDLANEQQRQMFIGCFAREVRSWMGAILRPNDLFVDIGANVGYLSLMASKMVGRGGAIVSVEPYPPNFDELENNVRRNAIPNVQAFQIAISDTALPLRLYVPPNEEQRAYNVTCVPSERYETVEVPAEPLDHFLTKRNLRQVRLMKVDVEGSEPKVLSGGANILKSGAISHLIIEINGPYLTKVNSSPALLGEQLRALGFRFANLASGRIAQIDGPELAPMANFDALLLHESMC